VYAKNTGQRTVIAHARNGDSVTAYTWIIQRTDGIFVWTSWYAPDAVIRGKLICGALDW
jgi:hypothetical protein